MTGLRGFGNPLSPSGRAALVEDLPHHISAEAIQVTYRVDPERAPPRISRVGSNSPTTTWDTHTWRTW